jgi:peptidoglycan/xylan/chitin deacetylase (PgdA/CDA1 family)
MIGTGVTRALYLLGVALFHLRLHTFVMWIGRKNLKVLLYHDCSDAEDSFTAGLGATVSPDVFGRHLEYVMRHYKVVDLESIERGEVPPRAVAITFDDGYRSVFDGAFPHLKRRGLPAVVYIITDVVDNERLVWVNELNYHLREYGQIAVPLATSAFQIPGNTAPEEIVAVARRNYDPKRIGDLLGAIRQEAGVDATELSQRARLYLDWDQILEMNGSRVTIGNHTKTHPNLAALPREHQREEIREAQDVLSSRVRNITSLAYPFGYHSSDTMQTAQEVGLTSVAKVGGSNYPLSKREISRVHVCASSEAGLFAQMEVVEPAKAWLRKCLSRTVGMRFGTR